jgi:DNA polymerase-3 subunit alpha
VLGDPKRPRDYSAEQYLKTPEQMAELFSDIPEAIENTDRNCQTLFGGFRLGKSFLPNYPIPEGMTMAEFFVSVSRKGLEERLTQLLDKNAPDYDEQYKIYHDRLDFELKIINQMGFQVTF